MNQKIKIYEEVIKEELFKIGPIVVFIWKNDENWPVCSVSENIKSLYGYSVDDFISSKLQYANLIHKDDIDRVFKEVTKASLSINDSFTHAPYRLKCADDTYKWVQDVTVIIRDECNNISHYIGYLSDITKLKEFETKLDNIVNTDMLTGYGNRYKLNNDIQKSKNPAIAILDIDNFSQVNDFYGNKLGDEAIKQLGEIIFQNITDQNCELYHLQGDEFVLLHQDSDKDIFIEEIKKLLTSISNSSIILKEEEININLSTAISFSDKENILETADMALKKAKKEHKELVVYDKKDSLNKEYENNLLWIKKIKEAIDQDEIVAVFQPIIENKTGKISKYESLVRIKEDSGKLISPFFFLDIAKQTRHYTSITKIMIQKSFDMFKEKKSISFSINLSIDDILNEDINRYIIDMMQKYDVKDRVVFEIVEDESIEDFEVVSSFIKKVKSFGAKIAIDDFGTGYSNFEYLLKLDIDFIKIDGSMIKHIDTDEDAQIVVSIIIDFAKRKGIKTIAEYVENESILNKVKELGIDYSQGYFFSEPKLTL